MRHTRLVIGLAFTSLALAQPGGGDRKCESLAGLKLAHASIVSAKTMAAGPVPLMTVLGPRSFDVPARCEVRGISRPSADSEIIFEVWLPLTAWNGKYRQQGNGGFAGTVIQSMLVDPVLRGYAAGATDNGHDAAKWPMATFAVGRPEKVIDFGYRAVHDTSVQAKAIVAAFYGTPPTRSYFVGCSDGGREALMEAQRFPEDFDGILAGAPAHDWSHLFTSFVWNELALTKSAAHLIPASKLKAIQQAVIAACDLSDRLKDGLVSNPRACRFDPGVLACKSEDRDDCLTAAQVETLKALYAGPKNPRTGQQIFAGLVPAGIEALPVNSWSMWILSRPPSRSFAAQMAISYFRDMVHERPAWDPASMDFDRDVRLSDEKVAPLVSATNPDLRSFRARGGKLIQFHGWGDAAIVADTSIEYYESVRSFLSRVPDPRSASKSVDDFYRLFMTPGLGHCSGGVGPVDFGNDAAIFGMAPPRTEADRDIFAMLEQWVEKGVAPDRLIGSGPSPLDPKKTLTRPLCPYPQQTRYSGSGDPNDAANFMCAAPAK